MATMAIGNTIRIPKTAKAMPQVRKRFCQTSSISLRTEALTTALSKLSEISRIESTKTIHRTCNIPAMVPVLSNPYQAASTRQSAMKMNEKV